MVPGDVVKNVPAVPSGPIKVNGPFGLFEPATWYCRLVFAGVEPFHDRVDQIGVSPPSGLLSFVPETRLPFGAEPTCWWVGKLWSRLLPGPPVPPLSAERTREPLAYV